MSGMHALGVAAFASLAACSSAAPERGAAAPSVADALEAGPRAPDPSPSSAANVMSREIIDGVDSGRAGEDATTPSRDGAGVPTEPDLPKPAGACPDFRAGVLTFNPPGGSRTVTITMSATATKPGGALVFYWHSTNNSPAEAQTGLPLAQIVAAGGIVVAPTDVPGAGTFPWLNSLDRHVALFDEVVGCAVGNPQIDPRRIHAVGFSAGALMTTHLSFERANTLASIAAYSGGTNERFAAPDHHKFAAMIMTGGKGDVVVQNFFNSSLQWKMTLDQAGHFTLFCDHGGSHTIPRALVPGVWQFLVDHPYGTTVSPYAGKIPGAIAPPCVP